MRAFLDEAVLPAEKVYEEWREERRGTTAEHELPPIVEDLKAEARHRGLWNLFLPDVSGLSNLEYAPVAEVTGWSPVIAPEAINCQAPDTGNMETLHLFGTPEQKQNWLEPLLAGEIRSGVRDDRARGRLVGRHQHHHLDPPRGRRVRHHRQEVVDLRRVRPALPDLHRHGQDRRRRPDAPPAVDGARPPRHPGPDDQPRPAGLRLPGPARALRDRAQRGPRAGGEPPRRGGRRLRHRPGPPRPGPHPPLHAPHRHGRARASTLMCGRANERVAFGKPLSEQGVVQRADRREPHRDRAGPPARAQGRLDDRQRRLARRGAPRSRPSR